MNPMDSVAYREHLKNKAIKSASICRRCGVCCGADNDPCENLTRGEDGIYACRVYATRLGPRTTVSGNIFNCVLIRDNITGGFAHPDCAYLKE